MPAQLGPHKSKLRYLTCSITDLRPKIIKTFQDITVEGLDLLIVRHARALMKRVYTAFREKGPKHDAYSMAKMNGHFTWL